MAILEAARMAPSAHNSQPYKFIVVRDAEKRRQLAKAALDQSFIAQAPVAIAIDHLTLAAVEENLGTCWIGAFSQKEVKEILEIPEKYKVVTLLPLGYPDDKASQKNRKELEELVCWENFY